MIDLQLPGEWHGQTEMSLETDVEVADLDDYRPIFRDLFRIWARGSEIAMAEYLMSVLLRSGCAEHKSPVGRARTICLMATFSSVASDVSSFSGACSLDDWRYSYWDLVGDFPRIEPFDFGRLAEREGLADSDSTDDEVDTSALIAEFVDENRGSIINALRNELGEAELFATLWSASSSDVSFPLPWAEVLAAVNDPTGEKVDAWGWMTDNFSA